LHVGKRAYDRFDALPKLRAGEISKKYFHCLVLARYGTLDRCELDQTVPQRSGQANGDACLDDPNAVAVREVTHAFRQRRGWTSRSHTSVFADDPIQRYCKLG
jgi:hypothetical protein